jgi:hypothetical protein
MVYGHLMDFGGDLVESSDFMDFGQHLKESLLDFLEFNGDKKIFFCCNSIINKTMLEINCHVCLHSSLLINFFMLL